VWLREENRQAPVYVAQNLGRTRANALGGGAAKTGFAGESDSRDVVRSPVLELSGRSVSGGDRENEKMRERAAGRRRRPEAPSGANAAVLVGFRRVGRDRLVGFEVQITFDAQPQWSASVRQFAQADVAEFRLAKTEIAQAEREILVIDRKGSCLPYAGLGMRSASRRLYQVDCQKN